MTSTHRPLLTVIALGMLMSLLALACAGAEPTATTAPVAPVATTAPVDTTAPVLEEEAPVVSVVPKITPDIIQRLPDMGVTELLTTFPAIYQPRYTVDQVKRGGVWTEAHWGADISTWDLRVSASHGVTMFANGVYAGLVQFDHSARRLGYADSAIKPDMAESWEYNADGTKLTFQLKQGVHWGDLDDPFQKGPEVVASDLVFVLTEYRDNSIQGGNYRTVTSIEAPSRYTLVLTFDQPSLWLLPFMASKDASMFNPYLAQAGRMSREMVGPGPWIMTEPKKSISVAFARNPNYTIMTDPAGNALPYLDGVVNLIVPETATRLALLRTGKVNSASSVVGNLRALQALLRSNPELEVQATPGSQVGTIASYQLNNPLFQDIRVRRALQLASDVRGQGNVMYGGLSMPSDKIEWYFWRDEPITWEDDLDALFGPYYNHFDLKKAKELWAEAEVGEVDLEVVHKIDEGRTLQASLLAADWQELGVTVKPKGRDYAEAQNIMQTSTQKDMILSWQTFAYDLIGVATARLHSTSPGNRENINDPIIDGLLDELALAQDPLEQRRITSLIRDQYNDQVYWASMASSAYRIASVVPPTSRGIRSGAVSAGGSLTDYSMLSVLREAWIDK